MTWQKQYQSRTHAEFYAEKRGGTFLQRLSDDFEQRMIRRALRRIHRKSPFHSALDCASGTGRMLPVLANFDVDVTALDFSGEMLEQGRRFHGLFRTPPGCVVGSALQLPLPDQSVDLVLCSRLIHHFPDPASRIQILREFARVARVGVVVSFFDRTSYLGWRRMRKKRKPHREHGRFAITRREFADEARSAGLKVLGMNALLRFHTEVTAVAMLPTSAPDGMLDRLQSLGLTSSHGLASFKPTSVAAMSGSSDTFRVDCDPTAGGPSHVYVKRYRYRGWWSILRGMFRGTLFGKSRARLEHGSLAEMRRRGVPAVRPMQWLDDRRRGFLRSSALITEGVPDAQPLDVYWPQEHERWPQERQLLFVQELARSVAQLHQAGVRHGGLYMRNILVSASGDGWSFTVLDPSRRCRFFRGPAPFAARVSDLSDLTASDAAIDWQLFWEPFVRAYGGSQSLPQDVAALDRAVRRSSRGKTEQEAHRVAVGTVLAWLRRRMEQSDNTRPAFQTLDAFFDALRAADVGGAVSKPVGIRFEFDKPAAGEGPGATATAGARKFEVNLTRQGVTVSSGASGAADLTVRTDPDAWLAVINAKPEALDAIRAGRLRLEGNVQPLALLAQWLDQQPSPNSDRAVA